MAIFKKKYILILSAFLIISCTSNLPKDYKPKTSKKSDGYIDKDRISHFKDSDIFLNKEKNFRIIFRVKKDDVEKVDFVYKDDEKKEMKNIGQDSIYDYFTVDTEFLTEEIEYYFIIKDGKTEYFYGENGIKNKNELGKFVKKIEQNKNGKEINNINAVYQIFIDSFYNGKTENDPLFNEMGPELFLKPEIQNEYLYVKDEEWAKDTEENIGIFNLKDTKKNWYENDDWETNLQKKVKWDVKNARHFGGDIKGIKDKITYLKELGITTIWINPAFYSFSNHKYNVMDFRHISPDFGTVIQKGDILEKYPEAEFKYYSKKGESEYSLLKYDIKNEKNGLNETIDENTWVWTESDIEFIEFIKELHENKIKIIMDLPVNYTSTRFWAFQDAIIKGPTSKYAKWYQFHDWEKVTEYSGLTVKTWNPAIEYSGEAKYGVYQIDGKNVRNKWIETPNNATKEEKAEIYNWNIQNVSYETWRGHKELPILNFKEEKVKKYFMESLKKWVKGINGNGIDGFRIDYINHSEAEYINELIKELKSVNEDLIIIGDIWKELLEDTQKYNIDAVTNYESNKIFLDWIINKEEKNKKNIKDLINEQNLFYYKRPKLYTENLFNFIDSYNTDRLFSMLINPDRKIDTNNTNKDSNYLLIRPDIYDEKVIQNYEMALFFQFTNIGIPVIYYGNEAGMWGADAPDSRKYMLWEKEGYSNESDAISKYKTKLEDFGQRKDMVIDEANKIIYYEVKKNEEIEKMYKKIIETYKKDYEIFKNGEIRYIDVEDNDCLIFERKYKGRIAIIIINRSEKKRNLRIPIEEKGKFTDIFSEKNENFDVIDEKIDIKLESIRNYILYKK